MLVVFLLVNSFKHYNKMKISAKIKAGFLEATDLDLRHMIG